VRIVIEGEGCRLEAELLDGGAAAKVAERLPLEASMSRWGDEYYGSVDLDIPEDSTARELMTVGEIAWWPPGRALCIFFGRTPASSDEQPRAASPVLPVGKVTDGLAGLKGLGRRVRLTFRSA